jgi:cell fate regulator YaaT (PSP1 superfamily)
VAHLVEVAFKGNRKEFFLWDYPDPPPLKAAVIVDVDRGEDLGYIHALGELAQKRNGGCSHGCGTSLPERKALRLATEKDRAISRDLAALNEEARRKAMERVRANALGMKLSDAEWQWDRKKLTLYFTADKRVDFRNLVRDLASMFRTRIELKQIGVRDEAKRLDGIGRCGRQYCSASWLPELRPVNLGVAKEQRLSLNPSQISGACGRLMCCLRYEHEFYVQSRKRFPKEGKIVVTSVGEEKVTAIDIFRERLSLRGIEGEQRTLTLAEFREETERAQSNAGGQVALIEEESHAETISPDEISPELMYTSEHPIPALRTNAPSPPSEPRPEAGVESEAASKRRRGRRGGRRGRGSDDGSAGNS